MSAKLVVGPTELASLELGAVRTVGCGLHAGVNVTTPPNGVGGLDDASAVAAALGGVSTSDVFRVTTPPNGVGGLDDVSAAAAALGGVTTREVSSRNEVSAEATGDFSAALARASAKEGLFFLLFLLSEELAAGEGAVAPRTLIRSHESTRR